MNRSIAKTCTARVGSFAVSAMLGLWPLGRASMAAAQVDDPEPEPDASAIRCRHARASAASQAYLLVSPSIWVEAVHVPRVGDETGAGLFPGAEYQLRAALSWSPIDVARGVLLLEQADTECELLQAATRLRSVLEIGDGIGELAARRDERQVFTDAADEVAAVLERANARLAEGLGTRSELVDVEAETVRISRRAAQLDAEIARLVEAGHERIDTTRIDEDLALYESRAMSLEDERSTSRRLAPWTVALRGGVVPGDTVDWFGSVQVGLNLGIVAHHIAENEAVDARRDEILEDEAEIRAHVVHLAERLRVGLPGLREELSHVERLIELQQRQRELLDGLETSMVEHQRAMNDLLLVSLSAERAHLSTLVDARARLIEDLHVD